MCQVKLTKGLREYLSMFYRQIWPPWPPSFFAIEWPRKPPQPPSTNLPQKPSSPQFQPTGGWNNVASSMKTASAMLALKGQCLNIFLQLFTNSREEMFPLKAINFETIFLVLNWSSNVFGLCPTISQTQPVLKARPFWIMTKHFFHFCSQVVWWYLFFIVVASEGLYYSLHSYMFLQW